MGAPFKLSPWRLALNAGQSVSQNLFPIDLLGKKEGDGKFFDLADFSKSAATSGVNSLLGLAGAAYGNSQTRRNMRLQDRITKGQMAYSQQLNKQYQEWLNNTQYGAQVRGMLGAGLSPAGSNTSVGAMQGSSGPSAGGSGPSGHAAQLGQMTDLALIQSQIDLNQSQAEKNRSDAKRTDIESGSLSEYMASQIRANNGSAAQSEQLVSNLSAERELVLKRIGLTEEQASNLKVERLMMFLHYALDEKKNKAEVAQLYASAKKLGVEASSLAKVLPYVVRDFLAGIESKEAQAFWAKLALDPETAKQVFSTFTELFESAGTSFREFLGIPNVSELLNPSGVHNYVVRKLLEHQK